MASFAPELKNRKNRDGRYPIYIRVSYMLGDRQVIQRISTGQFIAVKRHFNPRARYGNWITTGEEDFDKINKELKAKIEKIKENFNKTGSVAIPTIIRGDGFFPYALQFIEQYNNDRQVGTYNTYQGKLSKLARYLGFEREKLGPIKVKFGWEDITPQFIRNYIGWLKKQGNGDNTIAADLRKIRAIFNAAEFDEVTTARNPFKKLDIKTKKSKKERLTIEELNEIRSLDLSFYPKAAVARDLFLFCMNCSGMRIGDALSLKVGEVTGQTLFYQMRKTGDPVRLKLSREAQEIVGRYIEGKKRTDFIFPSSSSRSDFMRIASTTAITNEQLKFIASLAGIQKKLSTHISRHTYSQLALDSSANPRTIQKALRHKSFATTEAYLRDLNNKDVDELNEAIFGG